MPLLTNTQLRPAPHDACGCQIAACSGSCGISDGFKVCCCSKVVWPRRRLFMRDYTIQYEVVLQHSFTSTELINNP